MKPALTTAQTTPAAVLHGISGIANLEPGAQFSRNERRLMDRYERLISIISGDPIPPAAAPAPSEFDTTAVAWCLQPAKLIVLWTAGIDVPPELWEAIAQALKTPPGRAALILTRPEYEAAWLPVVRPFLSGETHLVLVRPGTIKSHRGKGCHVEVTS